MTRRRRAVQSIATGAALAALLLTAAPGVAGPGAGRIPDWSKSRLKEDSLVTRIMYTAAICFRFRHPSAVEGLLSTQRYSAEEDKAYEAAVADDEERPCFRGPRKGTIKFASRALMRGAFAEALYNYRQLRPTSAAPLTLRQSFQSLTGPMFAASDPDVEPRVRNEIVAFWVALCAAHEAPRQVHAILQLRPAAPGETRALNALGPVFLGCLPEGRSLGIERLTMRTLLAEGLYHAQRTHPEAFR